MSPGALKVARVELAEKEASKPGHGCAVVQAWLSDGREFSILAATPSWFEEAFRKAGLPYYFGPPVLFLQALESTSAKRAVQDMLSKGDRWLCVYDTPRKTLPQVLGDFAQRHAQR